ncbi:MAG: elongation factor P--(R)-beta-lysine ligase [Idiomarina sp.]|nr:elongation factor P--(R)-beta-lysine ligase [Idiomarina sp.]
MSDTHWRPVASREAVFCRSEMQREIREFFRERGVLEVETPLLAQAGVTDRHVHNATVQIQPSGSATPLTRYLQTSPEYAMKRLLAAGFGDCFQLARVVRDDELSRRHNPEFTLLEWYRIGFDDQQLMAELSELLVHLLDAPAATYMSYREAFKLALGVDPIDASQEAIAIALNKHEIDASIAGQDRDTLLQLAMSFVVEPSFDPDLPTFVYNFPASQAALARVNEEDPGTAHRFELYYRGLELANGFWELTDAVQQRQRFERDNEARLADGMSAQLIDENLLSALSAGLPDCAGVAVGVDRLLMIKLGLDNIADVLTFPFDSA